MNVAPLDVDRVGRVARDKRHVAIDQQVAAREHGHRARERHEGGRRVRARSSGAHARSFTNRISRRSDVYIEYHHPHTALAARSTTSRTHAHRAAACGLAGRCVGGRVGVVAVGARPGRAAAAARPQRRRRRRAPPTRRPTRPTSGRRRAPEHLVSRRADRGVERVGAGAVRGCWRGREQAPRSHASSSPCSLRRCRCSRRGRRLEHPLRRPPRRVAARAVGVGRRRGRPVSNSPMSLRARSPSTMRSSSMAALSSSSCCSNVRSRG